MSKYTIELGLLIESDFDIWKADAFPAVPSNYDGDTGIIALYIPYIQARIAEHFYFNEIGTETPERFKHYLADRLKLIMPNYYNILGAQYLVKISDMLKQYDSIGKNVLTGTNGNTTTTTPETVQTTAFGETDTPNTRSSLDTLDYFSKLSKNTLTNSGHDTTTNAGTNGATSDNTGHGRNLTTSELFQIYKANLYDVDEAIFKDLRDLFMLIW